MDIFLSIISALLLITYLVCIVYQIKGLIEVSNFPTKLYSYKRKWSLLLLYMPVIGTILYYASGKKELKLLARRSC